jgi:hypothetical protein
MMAPSVQELKFSQYPQPLGQSRQLILVNNKEFEIIGK